MKRFLTLMAGVIVLCSLAVSPVVNAEEVNTSSESVIQNAKVTEQNETVTKETDTLKDRAEGKKAVSSPEYTASSVKDIPDDYWAVKEINAVIKEGIMPLNEDGTFSPDTVVSRVDFATWILNALSNSTFQITVHNNYSDINEQTPGYETILRNDQLGLIYGYPDGTFKPDRIITKAETNSIMSHITKDLPSGDSVLGGFKDVKSIPQWALHTYEKTVRYDLYVNNPDLKEFLPNKQLNRAEAAVLLYKLRQALNLVKKVYRAENLLGVEHLDVTPLAPANTIQVTDKRLIVDEGNVLKIAFSSNFNSKHYKPGDEVHFYAKNDVKTTEGTLVFPAETKFLAAVETIQDPKWLNKNAQMTITVKSATLPDGKVVNMNAAAFENQGVLTSNRWEKPLFWTLGGTITGTGVGLAAGLPTDNLGLGLAIGIPTGAAVGAAVGFLTPGVNFGASEGDEIYILVKEAFSIYNCSGDDAE